MARKPPKAPAPFVDIHGRPIDMWKLAMGEHRAPPPPAPKAPAAGREAVPQPQDIEAVFEALCMAGLPRGKTWLAQFMRHLGSRHSSGRAFSIQDVTAAAHLLVQQGRAVQSEGLGVDAAQPAREAWLQAHLEPDLAAKAYPAWARASATYNADGPGVPPPALRDPAEAFAFARLLLYAGLNASAFASQRATFLRNWDTDTSAIAKAAMTPFMPERFEQLDPALRNVLLKEWLDHFILETPLWTPLMNWLDGQAQRAPDGLSFGARAAVAEWRCDRADAEGALKMLTGLEGPRIDAFKAAVVAIQGQWGAAADGFAAAQKALSALANARRGLLSTNHLRLYLLCLLAQPQPQAWTAARKLATAESGSRKPPPSDWGLWAHAAAARMGDEPVDAAAFAHQAGWGGSPHRANADRLVLAAWLGHEPAKWGPAEVDAVVQHFESMGRTLWADLLRQAAARFGWAVPAHTRPGAPWGVAYFGGPR